MADDRRRTPNWRTTGGRAGSSGGVPVEPGKKRPGGKKRFVVLAAFLAIIGFTIGLVLYLGGTPHPIFVGFAVAEYNNVNYPPNPWAQQESEALRALFGADSEQAFAGQEKHRLLEKLNDLAKRTSAGADKNRPLIVHLCALGISVGGKAYILPGDAAPGLASSWLALEELLTALRAMAKPPLLLLDVARPVADARLGLLTDDVATAIDAELTAADQAGKLPFFVLTACGPGQTSQVSPELRRSLFGYFVEQGLLGRADGWSGSAPDAHVSAQELINYVRVQVPYWAASEHLPAQSPTSYGKGKEFDLIAPPKKPDTELPGLEPPSEYPKWLEAGWKLRDDWLDDGTSRVATRTFRQLEESTLRAERRWLAGVSEEALRPKFEAEKKTLESRHAEFLPIDHAPLSLAELKRAGVGNEKADERDLENLMQTLKSTAPPNPMALAEVLKPFLKPPPEPIAGKLLNRAGLAALLELNEPTPDQLKTFNDFFKKFPRAPWPAELHQLQFVLDQDPNILDRWQKQNLTTAKSLILRSGAAADRAGTIDPRILPWLVRELDSANRLRRDGLIRLTTGDIDAREEGMRNLSAALKNYDAIEKAAGELERAETRLDDAIILLPGLAPAFGNRPANSAEKDLWTGAVTAALALQQLLSTGQPGLPLPAELNAQFENLHHLLRQLRALYKSEELERVLRQSTNPGALRRELEAPGWSGPNRRKLYAAAQELERKLTVMAQAKVIELERRPDTAPPSPGTQPATSPEWRASLAIDLLRLDGLTDTKALQVLLEQAKSNKSPETWAKLGSEIRKAWAVELADKFSKYPAPTPAQRRAGFIVHPFDVGSVPVAQSPFECEPAVPIRRDETLKYWNWLANQRYLADAAVFAEAYAVQKKRLELGAYATALEDIGTKLKARKP